MATPVKVYPLQRAENGLPLAGVPGVPHVAHEVATKKEAEELLATGAWTDNPNHSDRVPANPAPDQPAPAGESEG